MRPSSAWPLGAWTIGWVTPATTWALVTTRSLAITKPEPDWFWPHAYAVPLIRTTDAAAAASEEVPVSTLGTPGDLVMPENPPEITGRPWASTADRSRARAAVTGSGVTVLMACITHELLTAALRTGMPRDATLPASSAVIRAPMTRLASAPPIRSSGRSAVFSP